MALPIRLLLANGKDEIDLVAQSIDMSVNRNVSAFPTPNNALKRFAVDTNIPAIKIDINGIFADDEGAHVDSGSTVTLDSEPIRSAINFGALLPTESFTSRSSHSAFSRISSHNTSSATRVLHADFISVNRVFKNQSSSITLRAPIGSSYENASSRTEEMNVRPFIDFKVNHPISGTYGSGSTSTIAVAYVHSLNTRTAEQIVDIGDRLLKEDGTLIGIVQSISTNNITFTSNIATALSHNDRIHTSMRVFNHIGDELGFANSLTDDPAIDDGDAAIFTLGLTDVNSADAFDGQVISINRRSDVLERFRDQTIKLIPSYWLENPLPTVVELEIVLWKVILTLTALLILVVQAMCLG